MKLSSRWSKRIGAASVAVLALGAYQLGQASKENPEPAQVAQNPLPKQNDPNLQSILDATQTKLDKCEANFLQSKNQLSPSKIEDSEAQENPVLPTAEEHSASCAPVEQKREMQMLEGQCREFERLLDSYKIILRDDQVDCKAVKEILGLAQRQYTKCIGIINEAEHSDSTLDPDDEAVDAIIKNAYRVRKESKDEKGREPNLYLPELIANPDCKTAQ